MESPVTLDNYLDSRSRDDFYPTIVDKQYLIKNYRYILEQGKLPPGAIENLVNNKGMDDPDIVIQSTSGSHGKPLLIPRTKADIENVAFRIIAEFKNKYGDASCRIALFGGISHSQAALKYKKTNIEMKTFTLDETAALYEFNPDVLSCYPSIARELIQQNDSLRNVKMIKLGGERLFPSDVKKIFHAFPGCIIVEQFGCTEMPCVAIRCHDRFTMSQKFNMQTDRYSFLLHDQDGWQPCIVKDNFTDLLFPINHYYNTGDEILIQNGTIMDVRRKNDPVYNYKDEIELLLQKCINVQIDLKKKTIYYIGRSLLPATVLLKNEVFSTMRQKPYRLKASNKLTLLL